MKRMDTDKTTGGPISSVFICGDFSCISLRLPPRSPRLCGESSSLVSDRLAPDVFAEMHAFEVDFGHGFVGAFFGVGDRIAQRGDAEDAAAVGEDGFAL